MAHLFELPLSQASSPLSLEKGYQGTGEACPTYVYFSVLINREDEQLALFAPFQDEQHRDSIM